ncbi:hypothetical protein J4434_01935 [Candidatus Woesearchaeota archaeon]|nr:hypothetical protein [Candidatus Woesearchaeota archaeon]
MRRVTNDLHKSSEEGIEHVIASWISPPFGIVIGYGIYTKNEAEQLSKKSQEERWGFPDFGLVYDKELLERKIEKLERKYTMKGLS